jgi:hypothetical protein
VWDGEYAESVLSKNGLSALAKHPLFRTVSLDRNFYRALTASQYARYAAMVPDDFRFVVKAPSLVTDATVRDESGRGMQANPVFLSSGDRAAGVRAAGARRAGPSHRRAGVPAEPDSGPHPGRPARAARAHRRAMIESLPDLKQSRPMRSSPSRCATRSC